MRSLPTKTLIAAVTPALHRRRPALQRRVSSLAAPLAQPCSVVILSWTMPVWPCSVGCPCLEQRRLSLSHANPVLQYRASSLVASPDGPCRIAIPASSMLVWSCSIVIPTCSSVGSTLQRLDLSLLHANLALQGTASSLAASPDQPHSVVILACSIVTRPGLHHHLAGLAAASAAEGFAASLPCSINDNPPLQ